MGKQLVDNVMGTCCSGLQQNENGGIDNLSQIAMHDHGTDNDAEVNHLFSYLFGITINTRNRILNELNVYLSTGLCDIIISFAFTHHSFIDKREYYVSDKGEDDFAAIFNGALKLLYLWSCCRIGLTLCSVILL